uniref:Uncharacterized protein n=1 Tax=Parascaris equorum TaxID=6256 RepID=A0A914RTQ9_PAREQ
MGNAHYMRNFVSALFKPFSDMLQPHHPILRYLHAMYTVYQIAPFIISDCLKGTKEVDLALRHLLSICDRYGVALLTSNLPPPQKRAFAHIYAHYHKSHDKSMNWDIDQSVFMGKGRVGAVVTNLACGFQWAGPPKVAVPEA